MDWAKYNNKLIMRGCIEIDENVLKSFKSELSSMNQGKEGRRYQYPDGMITILAYIHLYFRLPYRQTQGLAISLFPGFKIPSYVTIQRRINSLEIKSDHTTHKKDNLTIAIDSTGIKVTNRGEWMRVKHGTERLGHIKLHVAVDIQKGTAIAVKITDEHSHDSNHFSDLVSESQLHGNVTRVLADGAYDSGAIFDDMFYNGIETAIPVRKNSRCDTASYPRRINVIMQKRDYTAWKKSTGYGKRWLVESFFGALKRMFGEYVTAHKAENMIHEIKLKVALYNRMVCTV